MAEHGARLTANRAAALARLAAAPAGAFPVADLALEGEGPRDAAGLGGRAGARAAAATWRPAARLSARTATTSAAVYAAKGVPARLCSTGEQKALLISMVLANAWAVAEAFGAAPVLLLDEVAAHLDAGRRAALYDGARRARAPGLDDRDRAGALRGPRGAAPWVSEAAGQSRVRGLRARKGA